MGKERGTWEERGGEHDDDGDDDCEKERGGMCILIEVSFEFRLDARSRSVERVVDGEGDAEQARTSENGGELHVFCRILRGKQALFGVSCKKGLGEMLIDEAPTDESYLVLGPLESTGAIRIPRARWFGKRARLAVNSSVIHFHVAGLWF